MSCCQHNPSCTFCLTNSPNRLLALQASNDTMTHANRVRQALNHKDNPRFHKRAHKQAKRPKLADDNASSDESIDSELDVNTEISYEEAESYQPCDVRGDEVLKMALNKAVADFEDKQIAKLIDDEYVALLM